jgi:hypothetical protein
MVIPGNLLTMATGLAWVDEADMTQMMASNDPVKSVLVNKMVEEPGTRFYYGRIPSIGRYFAKKNRID